MEFGGTRALAAGMALFGATAVAVASVPMIENLPKAISSMALPRVENARIALMTDTADLYTLSVAALETETVGRVASSELAAPLALLIAGLDLANGDNQDAYEQLKQLVDAPQYILDPLIVAASDNALSELGGGTVTAGWDTNPTGQSGIIQFRDNVMVDQWRADAEALLANLMGVSNATSIPDTNAAANLVSTIESQPSNVSTALSSGVTDVINGVYLGLVDGDVSDVGTGINEMVDAPFEVVKSVLQALAAAVPAATTATTFNNIAADVTNLENTLNARISAAFPSSTSATTSSAATSTAAVTSTASATTASAAATTASAVATTASAAATTASATTTASTTTTSTLSAAKATLSADKTALTAAKSDLSTAKSQLQADKTAGVSAQTLTADKQAVSSAKADVKADKSTVKADKSTVKADKTAAKAAKGK